MLYIVCTDAYVTVSTHQAASYLTLLRPAAAVRKLHEISAPERNRVRPPRAEG